MKFKLMRRRMSISAPRMTVKTHVPWPLRIAVGIVVLALAFALGLFLYESGKDFAGFGRPLKDEVVRLRAENSELREESTRLKDAATAAQSRLEIEKSTQAELGTQIRSLELENAKLKDDAAFFENLSSSTPQAGVAIKRLEVRPDAVPGQFHYRILVTQGGGAEHEFTGDLQLLVTLQEGGKAAMMNLPDPSAASDPKAFQISFRFFKRLEGTFKAPAGAVVKQVEARILERGAVRSQQSVAVS